MRREFSSPITVALNDVSLCCSFELTELEDRERCAFFDGLLLLELVLEHVLCVVDDPSSSLSDDLDLRRNILPIDRGFFARRSERDLKRLCGVAMI